MASLQGIAAWAPPVVPFGTAIVTVLVGPTKQKFSVHKDLICASSKFFASAFTGGYAETQSGEVKLPHFDPKIFEIFHRYIYSGLCENGTALLQLVADPQRQPDKLLLDLYRMADYLLVPGLQLLVIEQVISLFALSNPVIPSREFIGSLFDSDEPQWMQRHTVKHIRFWVSRSQNAENWTKLFQLHEKLALETATEFALHSSDTSRGSEAGHPSSRLSLHEHLGLDIAKLRTEARGADKIQIEKPKSKVLARSELHDQYKFLDRNPDIKTVGIISDDDWDSLVEQSSKRPRGSYRGFDRGARPGRGGRGGLNS